MPDNEKLDELRRRQLVDRYSKRADEAANFFRAVLFALATVSDGVLISKNYDLLFNPHCIPIAFFTIAIGLIAYSWYFQKSKSLARVRALEAENWHEEFRSLQKEIESKGRNETIDKCAAALICAGFFGELMIKITNLYGN